MLDIMHPDVWEYSMSRTCVNHRRDQGFIGSGLIDNDRFRPKDPIFFIFVVQAEFCCSSLSREHIRCPLVLVSWHSRLRCPKLGSRRCTNEGRQPFRLTVYLLDVAAADQDLFTPYLILVVRIPFSL
jgi:hypothetical protein